LEKATALFFRDRLREARGKVLRDSEGFLDIIHVVEEMGSLLLHESGGSGAGLGRYEAQLSCLANGSPLSSPNPPWHGEFARLYNSIRVARNDAVHQGAYSRHLASNSVRLSIILEDALMTTVRGRDAEPETIEYYMVRNPVCASMWQPISFIRQAMLENSFTYLPVFDDAQGRWRLVSDFQVALYLESGGETARHGKLKTRLRDAIRISDDQSQPSLELVEARVYPPATAKQRVLRECQGLPVLVTHDVDAKILIGIVTPFDLL
jgi:hypothetical protein